MGKPSTVTEYLDGATKEQHAALNKLRKVIKATDPGVVENLAYGMIGYKYGGKRLIYLGYAKNHCGVYGPLSIDDAELRRFDRDKGTLRFQPDHPPSDRLIKKLVRARIAEIEDA